MSFGGASGADFLEGRLPVFVFPTNLAFYTDDPQSHTRVITIYNPYDFPLTYKILSTDPAKYSVSDSEGTIKSRCSADVLIRHVDVSGRNEGLKEKFRIQLCEYKKKKILGRRDIVALLLPTQDNTKLDSDRPFSECPMFANPVPQETPHFGTSASRPSFPPTPRPSPAPSPTSSVAISVFVTAVVCLLALMLPSSGDLPPSFINLPDYLYLTLHQKLLAAYVLGMITVIVFRR